jgi:hypothetical protein
LRCWRGRSATSQKQHNRHQHSFYHGHALIRFLNDEFVTNR